MRSPGSGPRASRSRSRVMSGCGASTQKRCPYGQAEGFLRHQHATATTASAREGNQAADQAPEKPIVCDAAGAAHEHDLAQVERDRPVGGLELVPAPRLAGQLVRRRHGLLERIELLRAEPRHHHLASVEPDLDPVRLDAAVRLVVCHQCSLRGLDDLGQHAAGRLRVQERDPAAADSDPRLLVDQLDAGPFSCSSVASMSSTAYATWCRPSPAPLDELADRRLGAERLQQLDVARRRRRAAPPRPPATRRSRGGRAASRRCPRRGATAASRS